MGMGFEKALYEVSPYAESTYKPMPAPLELYDFAFRLVRFQGFKCQDEFGI